MNYRSRFPTTRATYRIFLDLSSPFSAVYTGANLYIHYLFSPFPWQVKNILDVYAVVESFMRMVLIVFSIQQWRSVYGIRKRFMGVMLILFFSMTFMWAMGTSNYGTAMRHHMLSWWIVVILGMPMLMIGVKRFRVFVDLN